MAGPDTLRRLRRLAFWPLAAAALGAAWMVLFRVDLTPEVGSDFFFSTEDPALRASLAVEELFPTGAQLLLSARGEDILSEDYLERLRALGDELAALPGVDGVFSLTHGPISPKKAVDGPFWSRLLLGSDPRASQLVVTLEPEAGEGGAEPPPGGGSGELRGLGEETAPEALIPRIEEVLARHEAPSFRLDVSGVPWVVELIRRNLRRDLRVFSLAALGVFGLLIALIYRSWRIVAGTLLTCLAACALTLALLSLLGQGIGALTANIVTIVFVLTLSHTVFLTANWRRAATGDAGDHGAGGAVQEALSLTFPASFWSMVTTLLGFSSLLFASAMPLRELGFSGALGTAVALVATYVLYPAFLGGRPPRPVFFGSSTPRLPGPAAGVVAALLCLAAAFGLPRTETDPELFSYFASGSEIRRGLERIDAQGGSSPLYLVVSDPEGGAMHEKALQERMQALLESLEEDPRVGTTLALPVLIQEARRVPLAFLLGDEQILAILESDQFGRVGRSFLSADREQALYLLRMREEGREGGRREVVERLRAKVAEAGFRVDLVGGLYDLQGKLGELVLASILQGLGGLFTLFLLVAWWVSRSARVGAAMLLCLAAVPALVLGTFGHLRLPLDLIASPAANVAIALGIDSMIHLVSAVRRRRAAGDGAAAAWAAARARMWPPILGAMAILATGFGIFSLSSFPPTQRFGLAVALGTLAAAGMTLMVLPALAARLERRS